MINAMSTPQPRDARPILHSATLPFKSGAARVVSLVAFTCVLLLVWTVFFVYHSFGSQRSANSINTNGLGNANSTESAAPADSFEGRAVNILISGIDSRQNQGDDANGDPDELSSIHSDTTMFMHISADRSRIQVVSIPRDLITDIPSCRRSDGTTSSAYTGMFNSAFSTGSNDTDIAGGSACTEATVEQLTGTKVDGFVVVDFHGFRGLIDALGGVWFDIPEDIDDSKSDLHVQAGCQKLDGKTALAYARTRYAVGDGSDLGRISNQQKLVAAIMRELMAKNFVSDLPSLLSFTKQGLSALQPSQNLSNINTSSSPHRTSIRRLTRTESSTWSLSSARCGKQSARTSLSPRQLSSQMAAVKTGRRMLPLRILRPRLRHLRVHLLPQRPVQARRNLQAPRQLKSPVPRRSDVSAAFIPA